MAIGEGLAKEQQNKAIGRVNLFRGTRLRNQREIVLLITYVSDVCHLSVMDTLTKMIKQRDLNVNFPQR